MLEDGTRNYSKNGERHRQGGEPAHEGAGSSKATVTAQIRAEWYVNGMLHRIDGPAVVYPDGTVEWLAEGVKLDEGKVLEAEDRMKAWWEDGVADSIPVKKLTF